MLVFGAVMAAEYVVFHRALVTVAGLGPASPALTLYFLESVMVLIFVLALLSFVASGLWVYYRARDTRLLLAAPLSPGGLYALRSLETFTLTSWSLGVVGLPALLALGTTYRQDAAFYAYGAVVLMGFAALTGACGALVTTVAGAALRRTPSRLAVAATVAVLLLAFAAIVGRNLVPSTADFQVIFEPGLLNGKPASIKFLEAKFGLWPSHPFAAALYTRATGGAAGSAATWWALWLAPLGALLGAATLGRRLYGRTLPVMAESFVLTAVLSPRAAATRFPRWLSGPVGALIERDLTALARSPHELGRAAFIALLLLLYTSFIVVAPLREVGDRPQAVARLLLFTVIASGYFITAFGLRFVFPSLSLEGRVAWVFFSSPVSVFRLVLARAVLYVALLSVTVVPIAMIGVVRLVREPGLVATMAALQLLLAAATATVLLAFGAAWPDFREPNPETLSTSGGGLAGTVVCLVYVAGMGWIAREAALASARGESVVTWLSMGAGASLALIAGALGLARLRLRTLEAR